MTDSATIIVTDLVDEAATSVPASDNHENFACFLKSSDTKEQSGSSLLSSSSSSSSTLKTPLRSARKANKDTPLSPVGQRHFPISLSPDEIKERRHNRAESYGRIIRSQTSLRLTRPPHLRNVTAGRDHIGNEDEN
jgi:hypothetical protein